MDNLEELAREERALDTLGDRESCIEDERAYEELQDMYPMKGIPL